ncbi:MAG: hypothetical protein KBS35_00100 [Mycoplasma sp.]|nr:hypothetical protein [Candidatus Hennigella equi]
MKKILIPTLLTTVAASSICLVGCSNQYQVTPEEMMHAISFANVQYLQWNVATIERSPRPDGNWDPCKITLDLETSPTTAHHTFKKTSISTGQVVRYTELYIDLINETAEGYYGVARSSMDGPFHPCYLPEVSQFTTMYLGLELLHIYNQPLKVGSNYSYDKSSKNYIALWQDEQTGISTLAWYFKNKKLIGCDWYNKYEDSYSSFKYEQITPDIPQPGQIG